MRISGFNPSAKMNVICWSRPDVLFLDRLTLISFAPTSFQAEIKALANERIRR